MTYDELLAAFAAIWQVVLPLLVFILLIENWHQKQNLRDVRARMRAMEEGLSQRIDAVSCVDSIRADGVQRRVLALETRTPLSEVLDNIQRRRRPKTGKEAE